MGLVEGGRDVEEDQMSVRSDERQFLEIGETFLEERLTEEKKGER